MDPGGDRRRRDRGRARGRAGERRAGRVARRLRPERHRARRARAQRLVAALGAGVADADRRAGGSRSSSRAARRSRARRAASTGSGRARSTCAAGCATRARSCCTSSATSTTCSVMNNGDRGRFRRIMRGKRRAWWKGRIPLAEQFAEAYSFCARYSRIVSISRYSTYEYRPTRKQHASVCRLIVPGRRRPRAVRAAAAARRRSRARPAAAVAAAAAQHGPGLGRPAAAAAHADADPAAVPDAAARADAAAGADDLPAAARALAVDLADALGHVGRERGDAVERGRDAARAVRERDRARLEPHAVGEDRALLARQLEPERGLLLEVARELARGQQPLGAERDRPCACCSAPCRRRRRAGARWRCGPCRSARPRTGRRTGRRSPRAARPRPGRRAPASHDHQLRALDLAQEARGRHHAVEPLADVRP